MERGPEKGRFGHAVLWELMLELPDCCIDDVLTEQTHNNSKITII
jgi:hypothetical protein